MNYNWLNPNLFNQQEYLKTLNQQNYEFEQNLKVLDAVETFSDLLDKIDKIDFNHQSQLFYAMLIELGKRNHWSN